MEMLGAVLTAPWCLDLHLLATSPAYQGKGAGGILIRWGLDQADKDGVKAYIEATPYALEIYKRYGWKVVDSVVNNLEDWDKSKVGRIHTTTCLLRPVTEVKTI
jgi:GNAT superfamily N-acetyltransferase